MTFRLNLAQHHIRDLELFCELGLEKLDAIRERVCSLPKQPYSQEEIRAEVLPLLDDTEDSADAVLRAVLSFRGTTWRTGLQVQELLEELDSELTKYPKWDKSKLSKWNDSKKIFRHLVESEVIRVSTKAIDLAYEHANKVRDIRLITDVRPLFSDDDEASDIEGAIVSFSLRLRYSTSSAEEQVVFALDEADVKGLLAQSERALKKGENVRRVFTDVAKIRTIVPGRAE